MIAINQGLVQQDNISVSVPGRRKLPSRNTTIPFDYEQIVRVYYAHPPTERSNALTEVVGRR
jgi:hypothetical protein